MTPHALELPLLAAVLISAGIAVVRIDWRQYPAWIASMLWQVFLQGILLGGGRQADWTIPISTALLAAMILEATTRSREKVDGQTGARIFASAFSGCAVLASLGAGFTTIQRAYLFRSWFLWACALAMISLCALRRRYPVLERRCDRFYRLGIALWIVGMAVSGSFVKGGIGYQLFPYTTATWKTVNVCAYVWLIALLPSMALAMARSAPGRKRAAKKPDGRTVVGLIEMQRVA